MTTYLSDLTVRFNFSRGEDTHTETEDYCVFDDTLGDGVDQDAKDKLDDLNSDLDDYEDQWEFDEFEVEDWDDDYNSPDDFADLNEYGGYAELIEKHGEAFHLWYDNCGDCTESYFLDCYAGLYDSEESFAQQFVSDHYMSDDIPSIIESNIDWEGVASDLGHDHTFIEGSEGTHVFRDC